MEELSHSIGPFSFIRQNTEEPIAVSALKFILAQPEITIALVGMNSVKDVEESVIAGEHIIPATPDLLEEHGKASNTGIGCLMYRLQLL